MEAQRTIGPPSGTLHILPWIAACAGALFFVWYPLTDSDIWWHLAAGREMVSRHSFIWRDPFAFTPTTIPWVNVHWLFQLCVYYLFQWGGSAALVFARMAAVATMVLIIRCFDPRPAYAWIGAALCTLMVFQTRYLLVTRPILVTLLCALLFLLLTTRYCSLNHIRYLVALVPVHLVWINCQGLWIIGPGIVAAAVVHCLVRHDSRTLQQAALLGATIALLFILALCTPSGIQGLLLPLRLFARINPDTVNLFSRNIAENAPFLSLQGFDRRYQVLVILLVVTTLAAMFGSRKWVPVLQLSVAAAMLWLAFCAQRNIILFVMLSLPATAIALTDLWYALPVTWTRNNRFRGVMAVLVLALLAYYGREHAPTAAACVRCGYLSPFRFPEAAVDHIERTPHAGQLFNASWHGGYLIWRLYPPRQVFMDGRFILRTPELFAEYLAACDTPWTFNRLADRYAIEHALVPHAIFSRYRLLIEWLQADPAWRLAYVDEVAVLFSRDPAGLTPGIRITESTVRDSIASAIHQRWQHTPSIHGEALDHWRRAYRLLTLQPDF